MAPGLIDVNEAPSSKPPPDIPDYLIDPDYKPNPYRYGARTAAKLQAGGLPITVPKGWPKFLNSPLCWAGAQLKNEQLYVYRVTRNDKREVEDALKHFKELELNGDEVDCSNFPLPNFGQRLRSLAVEVSQGKGFCIVRGIDPKAHSREDSTVIFLGISSYIGQRRGRQDRHGNMLRHLVDSKSLLVPDSSDQTHNNQQFHNDICPDILALWTISCAAKGGESVLASSWNIYNNFALTRPDLIHVLAKPNWPIDTYGHGGSAYQNRPLLFHEDGKIILNFTRYLLTGRAAQPRTPGIPPISFAQVEALDALHFTAEKYSLKTSVRAGDMRFINNLALLHCRESYMDDKYNQRHLIRLWLRNNELGWKIPPPLKEKWDQIFNGDSDIEEKWPIVPLPEAPALVMVELHEGCYF